MSMSDPVYISPSRPRDRSGGRGRRLAGMALAVGLAMGCAPVAAGPQPAPVPDPTAIDCPSSVGRGVTCLSLQDEAGAWLIIARPESWNGHLIVHAHGGPRMGEPERGDCRAPFVRPPGVGAPATQ